MIPSARDPAPPTLTRRPWLRWLVALVPALPILVVMLLGIPPRDPARVLDLNGEWRLLEGDSPAGADPALDDTELPGYLIPGPYHGDTPRAGRAWLRRHLALPPALRGQTLYLSMGYVANGWVEVHVNGHHIGGKGVQASGFYLEQASVDGWYVPRDLLHPDGDNLIALEVAFTDAGHTGFLSRTLLLGDPAVVKRHHQQNVAIKNLLEQGALVALLFLGALVGILLALSWGGPERSLYLATLGLLLAVALYLVGKTGVPISFFVAGRAAGTVIILSINLIGLFGLEFVEQLLLGRTSRFRRVNRVVCTILSLLTLAGLSFVYSIAAPYLFVIIAWILVLSLRSLARSSAGSSPALAVTVVIVALAGVNDLVTDLNLWVSPRLFAVATANFGFMAALLVIGRFMRLAQENKALSASLTARNVDLAQALVQAQESARLKSEFLANTSHELRTPLNAIINIPQGLIEQYQERAVVQCSACGALFEIDEGERVDAGTACPSCRQIGVLAATMRLLGGAEPEEQVNYLRSVVAAGRHLLAVVNDILDFSKLEAGRMELHLEDVDAVGVVREVLDTTSSIADKRGIALSFEPPVAPLHLSADRVKLTQILINLVSNAIKFSPDGGRVQLRARSDDEVLVLEVQDRGIGIAPEHHDLIFESFRQVEGGHTRRYSGTGLGLAITKKLVELHGGRIEVQSALGQGATFRVLLPRDRAASSPFDADAVHTRPGDDLVLLVDDESHSLITTELSLRPLGMRVRTLRDPLQVLPQLRAGLPRLLILDVMMPRKSGLEILRELRADPALRALPVLVASAYPDNEPLVRALDAGWLAKPWQPGAMLSTVSAMLAHSAPYPSGEDR